MRHKLLITIDQLLKPIYVFLNTLKWVKRKHCDTQNFIVIKFFGIGSITRIVHVINTINIATNRVTFITLYKNKAVIDLLDANAMYIKTKHPLVLISSIFKVVFQTWRQRQTSILDMERASNASGIFRLLIGIGKQCNSFYFKPKNKNKNGQFFVSLQNKSATKAISELFKKTYTNPSVKPNKKAVSAHKVYVNINAGDYLPERKFTLPEYATLIKMLHNKNPDWHFYLTGVKSEYEFVTSFKERLINKGIPLKQTSVIAGEHNLSEFVNCLKEAKLCITNDSGPLHLAHFFGVKTAAIWGPTSSQLVGYQNSEQMLNLELDMHCSPCFFHPKSHVAKYCQGDLTCFKSMNPEEMASKIIRFVESDRNKD